MKKEIWLLLYPFYMLSAPLLRKPNIKTQGWRGSKGADYGQESEEP